MISLLLTRCIIILLAKCCIWQNSVATFTSVFSSMLQKVESSAYLMSSLFLDNVFNSYAKTRNNVYVYDLGLNNVQSQAVMGN